MTGPTSHPEDLLAAYVDGELDDEQRGVVEAHLATCDRCREEVRLARSALGALAALPDADVPRGTLDPVSRSIEERTGAQKTVPTQRSDRARRDPTRVLAGLAIAAVLVVVGGIVVAPLLRSGGGGGVSNQEAAGAPEPVPVRAPAKSVDVSRLPPPSVQRQQFDYDARSIENVAQVAAHDPVHFARSESAPAYASVTPAPSASSGGAAGTSAPVSGQPATQPSPAASSSSSSATDQQRVNGTTYLRVSRSQAESVSRCVAQWTKGKFIVPKNLHALRILSASYQGQPATVAVYLQTRSGHIPPKVLIWVLDGDCRLISFVQRAL